MELAIAMIVAYIPFIWYLIDSDLKKRSESEYEKRKKEYEKKKRDWWS